MEDEDFKRKYDSEIFSGLDKTSVFIHNRNLNFDGWPKFFKKIKQNQSLQVFNLSCSDISKDKLKELIQILSNKTNLVQLNLKEIDLDNDTLNEIGKLLQEKSTLKQLRLN